MRVEGRRRRRRRSVSVCTCICAPTLSKIKPLGLQWRKKAMWKAAGGAKERQRERARARVLPNPRLPPHPGERYTHSVFHAFRRRNRITQRPNLHCRRHRTKPSPSLIAAAAAGRRKFGLRRPMIKARVTSVRITTYNLPVSHHCHRRRRDPRAHTRRRCGRHAWSRTRTHVHATAAAAACRDVACAPSTATRWDLVAVPLTPPSLLFWMTATGAVPIRRTVDEIATAPGRLTATGGSA